MLGCKQPKKSTVNYINMHMQTQTLKKIYIWGKRQLFLFCFTFLLLICFTSWFITVNNLKKNFFLTVPKIKMNNMCNFLSVYIPCLHGRNLKLLNRTDQNTQKVKKNVFNGTVQITYTFMKQILSTLATVSAQ